MLSLGWETWIKWMQAELSTNIDSKTGQRCWRVPSFPFLCLFCISHQCRHSPPGPVGARSTWGSCPASEPPEAMACLVESGQGRGQEGEGTDPGVLRWAQDPERLLTFLWLCIHLKSTALVLSLCSLLLSARWLARQLNHAAEEQWLLPGGLL